MIKATNTCVNGKKVCLLGRHGFLGSAIEFELIRRGATVVSTPQTDVIAVLNFASPTHIPFEQNIYYHTNEFLNSTENLLQFCSHYDIHYIWPSSALVYEKDTAFSSLKHIGEMLQTIYSAPTLALRIFPVYGASEGGRGHATAIYQWCTQMSKGKRPVVYGDGTQGRDFVYIDDVAKFVVDAIEYKLTGVCDVGTGVKTSFNEIVEVINVQLGTDLKPVYKVAPKDYSSGIVCGQPIDNFISIKDGVKKILHEINRIDK